MIEDGAYFDLAPRVRFWAPACLRGAYLSCCVKPNHDNAHLRLGHKVGKYLAQNPSHCARAGIYQLTNFSEASVLKKLYRGVTELVHPAAGAELRPIRGSFPDSPQNAYMGLYDDIPHHLRMKKHGKWVNCTHIMSICKNEATKEIPSRANLPIKAPPQNLLLGQDRINTDILSPSQHSPAIQYLLAVTHKKTPLMYLLTDRPITFELEFLGNPTCGLH